MNYRLCTRRLLRCWIVFNRPLLTINRLQSLAVAGELGLIVYQHYKLCGRGLCCRKSTSELLPMLCYLCDHGNVTLHQWKTGEIPQVRYSVEVYRCVSLICTSCICSLSHWITLLVRHHQTSTQIWYLCIYVCMSDDCSFHLSIWLIK